VCASKKQHYNTLHVCAFACQRIRVTYVSDPGVSDDVTKTKRDTDLISIEDVQEIAYAESNGHVTDDVTRPYDVIVVT